MPVNLSHTSVFDEQYGKQAGLQVDQSIFHRFLRSLEKHRLEKVSESFPSTSFKSLLEIGCGDGFFLKRVEKKWKRAVGIDVVPHLISLARKKSFRRPAEFHIVKPGSELVRFADEQFDGVVSIATFQYLPFLYESMSEIKRVLRPNGYLIFEVPNAAVLWRRIFFLFGRLPKTTGYANGWRGGVIYDFTEYDTRRFLEREGFFVEKVVCAGILDSLRSRWPSLLGADLIFICRKSTEYGSYT